MFTPRDSAFDALTKRLGAAAGPLLSNRGLMQQVIYHHIATGAAGGAKAALPSWQLKPGMRLNTMLSSSKGPYTLEVAAAPASASPVKLAVKAAGSSANVVRADQKCGQGYAHQLDNVLLPFKLF